MIVDEDTCILMEKKGFRDWSVILARAGDWQTLLQYS